MPHSYLVEGRAPNTSPLLDPSTGKMKRLLTFLMADYWETDAEAKRQCLEELMKLDITPLLPRGDSHAPGDGCNPWPPPTGGRGSPGVSALATSDYAVRTTGAQNAASSVGATRNSLLAPPLRVVGATHRPSGSHVVLPKRMQGASFRPMCSSRQHIVGLRV